MEAAPEVQFEFIPPPEDLGPYLNSLYILEVGPNGVEEMLPAYSGQLMLVGSGGGGIDFGDGFVRAPGTAFVIGPLSSARRFAIDGPALSFGASLTFHGWAALTGMPVAGAADRFVTVEQAFGELVASQMIDLAGEAGEAGRDQSLAILDRLVELLRPKLSPLPAQHAKLVEVTYAWLSSSLNPSTTELLEELPYSPRQVQRLVTRFFGLPPARLKRRYRAIRAATLLSSPDTPKDVLSETLNSFYDQAHLIREIREFTGRTPRLLALDSDSLAGSTLGADGYGVVDLFGGGESEQLARKRG